MKDTTKKSLVIVIGLIISVVLIVLIASKFQSPATEDVGIVQNEVESTDIVVDEPDDTEENLITPPEIEIQDESTYETTSGDDVGTEQTIQPDVEEKPTYTEEQLSDPTQTPNGIPVESPTEENPEPTPVENQTATESSGSGLPGFDSVIVGGENQGTYVDDMYENGNKVGIMD